MPVDFLISSELDVNEQKQTQSLNWTPLQMPPKTSYQPVDIEEFDENGKIKQFTEDYDDDNDIIGRIIGDIGKYQWRWVVILSLFQVISTFNIISFSFQVSNRMHVDYVYLTCRYVDH